LSDRARQPMPGGGLFSTAADLAKFCQMILNGGTLAGRKYLSPEKVKQMTSRQTAEGIAESYGFGWTTREGLASHNGAWKTNMTVDVRTGLITIFLVQVAGWRDEAEGKKIEPAFRQAALAAFGKRADGK
jgi:CubicO group peptidase (beta-lactamase class C family)